MTEVVTTCRRCFSEIAVHMNAAVLRMDVEPRPRAELLFRCPWCEQPSVNPVGAELLSLLLFVGIVPLRLSEPSLPDEDRAPPAPPLTPGDLLEWHEQLAGINFVTPWER